MREAGLRREIVGYIVWSVALIVFAVPELWASKDSDLPFPTLSGTIGHLERRWDWSAIFVVFAIVYALIHAVRVGAAVVTHRRERRAADEQGETASPPVSGRATTVKVDTRNHVVVDEGRVTLDPTPVYMGWFGYFVFAGLIVVAGFLIPLAVYDWNISDAEKQLSGEAGYGAIGLAFFLIPALLAYKPGRLVPFPTIFRSFLDLEQRAQILAVVVAAGLTFLMLHLVFYPYPSVIPWFVDLEHLHNHCARQAGELVCSGK